MLRPAHVFVDARARQLLWLVAAALIGFLVPSVCSDLLDLPRDAYYAVYIATVLLFFAAWLRASDLSVRTIVARNRRWAVLLGAGAGAGLAAIVLTYDSTSHPHGLSFAGSILWRGILYGAADGLLLGAFPVLAVFTAFPFKRGRAHILRTVATGAAAVVAALSVTAAYHAGYPDFRSSKLTAPLRGAAIWSAPTLLTLNPLGSVIAHIGLHVTAVIHTYQGDTFLPPHAAPTTPSLALRPCVIAGFVARGTASGLDVSCAEAAGAQPFDTRS